MAQETKPQKETIERVMHEFKHGELTAGASGEKVANPKQAVAIALSEAGASREADPAKNRQHARRTRAKEARGLTAEAETEGKRAQDRTLARGGARSKKTADAMPH